MTMFVGPPENGIEIICNALQDLDRPSPSSKDGLDDELTISHPLPLYAVELKDLADRQSVDVAAKLYAWRYLIEGFGGGIAFADLKIERRGGRFLKISESKIAERLLDATHLAEDLKTNIDLRTDIRLLDVPSLKAMGLWVGVGAPLVISIIDGFKIFARERSVFSEDEFLSGLVRAARSVKTEPQSQATTRAAAG